MTEHVTIVRTESVAIDSVTPHPSNPRRGDVSRIERSLRDHGQYSPIVVHEQTGHILVGNHRWRVMKDKLGWSHVDARFVSCSDAKALQVLAMDNRSSDDGTYDDAELLTLLESISDDLPSAGYDVDDLDDLLARLEESAPLPEFDPEANQRGIDTRKANGQDATVRSIVLTYPVEEYEQVVLGLQHMAQRFQVQDFASAVALMIAELED
jgi:hypothetical protein